MSELANRMVGLEDILGSEAVSVRERLGEMASWPERFAFVEALIFQRLGAAGPRRPDVSWAYRKLLKTRGSIRIGVLAKDLGVSRRHLIQTFRDEIGLPPKTVARLARFGSALARARSDAEPDWADIAAGSGYADQAHLSREFREFCGETPTAWHHGLA